MATLQQLEQAIFALDRRAEVEIRINGEILTAGLDNDAANLKGIDIQYDIEQLTPTCSLSLVNIPTWVTRDHTVEINAGYDGELDRIFTGHVKRRRHGVSADTIECVGRTAVLTRPFRSSGLPKSWTSQTAVFAINDILDDLTPPFVPSQIDPIVRNDGSDWVIGTQKTVFLDSMSASDMIRKIADVYGHRVFELKSGTLRIRPLLEAPAPTGFRTYSTRTTDADRTVSTTLSFDDTNIDAARLLGDVAANTRRSQGFQVIASGSAVRASIWMQKVGAPTVRLRFVSRVDSVHTTRRDENRASGASRAVDLAELGGRTVHSRRHSRRRGDHGVAAEPRTGTGFVVVGGRTGDVALVCHRL